MTWRGTTPETRRIEAPRARLARQPALFRYVGLWRVTDARETSCRGGNVGTSRRVRTMRWRRRLTHNGQDTALFTWRESLLLLSFEGRQIDRMSPPIARSAMMGFERLHGGATGVRHLCLHFFVGLDDSALQFGRERLCAPLINPIVGISQERDGVLQRRPLVGAAL